MKRLIFILTLATGALSIVFAASASEEAKSEVAEEAPGKKPEGKESDAATKIMNDVTRGHANPSAVDKKKSDPWTYATELEQKSQTRLRRAEMALKLTEERLTKLLGAEKRRQAQVAAATAKRATREETLQKLAFIYTKMKVPQAGKVLAEFDIGMASDVLALMPPKKAAKIIASMAPKKAARLLQRWIARGQQ